MKVKELPFLYSKDLQKLREVAEMGIVEFLILIDKKKDEGIKVNKPYQDLYNKIQAKRSQLPDLPKTPPIQQSTSDLIKELEAIPIDELKLFYQNNNIIDKLKSGGIVNIGQLYGANMGKISRVRNVGPATLEKIRSIRRDISRNPGVFIDSWHESQTIYELPSQYDRSLGLEANLKNAIIEYAKVIESNLDNKRYINTCQQRNSYSLLASILKQFYIDNKNYDQIAKETGHTRWHIENIRSKCVAEIFSGTIPFNNYRLNKDFLDLLKSLKEECLYDPIYKFEIFLDPSDNGSLSDLGHDIGFLSDLGLDILEIKGISFLIPKDTKGIYTTVWKVIYDTLKKNPLPTDIDIIFQLVIDNEDLADVEYDILFVDKILACNDIVENRGNHMIQIKNEYLSSEEQRYARIIYEADHPLTRDEVRNQYEAIYKKKPGKSNSLTRAKEYGISHQGCIWYYGQPKTSIRQKISDYAEEKGIFYFSDLEQELLNDGYIIPSSIRVYVTNVCAVDNEDKNHFCHKDCVDNYPEYKWRNPTIYGWANWIFNEIKNILNERVCVPLKKMIDELVTRSKSTEYRNVRERIQHNRMADYCGDDKPFILKEGNVVINQSVYEVTDFETIGLRGVKYAYFKQIRSLVANEVKKVDNGRVKLVDIIQLVNDTMVDDEPLSRNVIIRAIKDDQHRFAPIDVELVSEHGILYAQWTKQVIVPEPVYVISTDENITDDTIIEINQPDNRPSIKYRQKVNWQDLNSKLKNELSFYGRWMQHENYKLEAAVDSFLDLISHSHNINLNEYLPLDLYEYLFAQTDSHDRYRYLKDIIIDFEAVLGDLYYYRYGEEPKTKGLVERAAFFPGLPNMLMYSRDNKGFARIASDILYHRNKVAHGDDIKLSSLETAKYIIEYVALFVYVVAKYYQPQE